MKKSKYSGNQIVSILKQAEAGQPVKEVWRKYRVWPGIQHLDLTGFPFSRK